MAAVHDGESLDSITVQPGAMSALLAELFGSPGDTPAEDGPALAPGTRVGRFEMVGELGRGGFGVVYEARDLELGRTVAFKLIRPGRRNEARESRLLLEAEAAARLSHPNIVTLFDLGRSVYGPYLVLELLRGSTVGALVGRGPLPRSEALRIAVEVARGLAHAHAAGVVHRDLAPGNVFVCDDGRVKILDLGMAHAFGREKVDGGTPGYMAPEQRQGLPEDARTDVYALGALLLTLLGLRPPEDGRAPGERLPLRPARVARVVGRMVARAPADRHPDAGAVLPELVALLPEQDARRRARRLRALAGLAALAVLGAGWWWSTRPLTVKLEGRSIAVLPFEDLSPEKQRAHLAEGLAGEIHDALTGVRALRVVGRGSVLGVRGLGVPEAARRLQVASVLEGSLRSTGTGLEVAARLLRAADGREVWSRTFTVATEAGVFEMQGAIAGALLGALGLEEPPPAGTGHARAPLPEAYALYLGARSQWENGISGPPDSKDREIIATLQEVVKLDPRFARGWAFLGEVIYNSLPYGPAETEAAYLERCTRSMEALDRAISLDPALGEAFSARGYMRAQCNMDWEGAAADLARGLELEPGSAEAWRRAGVIELYRGRSEQALRSIRRATDLDPLLAVNWGWLTRVYWSLGRYPEGRAAAERALALSPGSWVAVMDPVFDLEEGRPAEALEHFDRATSETQRLRGRALALHDLGRNGEAQAVLQEILRKDLLLPYGLAQVYAWWGDTDRALEALERHLATRRYPSIEARWDPMLRNLRSDPRYWTLLRRAGFPE